MRAVLNEANSNIGHHESFCTICARCRRGAGPSILPCSTPRPKRREFSAQTGELLLFDFIATKKPTSDPRQMERCSGSIDAADVPARRDAMFDGDK